MKRIVTIVVLLILLCPALAMASQTVSSPNHYFTFKVPVGWHQVASSDDDILLQPDGSVANSLRSISIGFGDADLTLNTPEKIAQQWKQVHHVPSDVYQNDEPLIDGRGRVIVEHTEMLLGVPLVHAKIIMMATPHGPIAILGTDLISSFEETDALIEDLADAVKSSSTATASSGNIVIVILGALVGLAFLFIGLVIGGILLLIVRPAEKADTPPASPAVPVGVAVPIKSPNPSPYALIPIPGTLPAGA